MCAETDQDRRHRQEVLRQMILLQKQREATKTRDHQNTFAKNIPFQRTMPEQVGSELFPLSTIIFTLDVPVIIINI